LLLVLLLLLLLLLLLFVLNSVVKSLPLIANLMQINATSPHKSWGVELQQC